MHKAGSAYMHSKFWGWQASHKKDLKDLEPCKQDQKKNAQNIYYRAACSLQ